MLPFTFLLFLLAGCAKEKSPRITIITPYSEQTYSGNQVVFINARAQDNDQLTREELLVTNETTANIAVINFVDTKLTDDEYEFTNSFICSPGTRYRIRIKASNHSTTSEETIYINSN